MTKIKGHLSVAELEASVGVGKDKRTLDKLGKAVADRCLALIEQRDTIRNSTLFHCRPTTTSVKRSIG